MRTCLLLACIAACFIAVSAQQPIPYRPDGYVISTSTSPIIEFEAYIDLLCPDCAAAWPNIQSVLAYYGEQISVTLHTFPLPYHNHGFQAAQLGHSVLDQPNQSAEQMIQFVSFMFQNQATFWNGVTANQTGADVVQSMVELVSNAGFMPEAALAAAMQDDNINEETRVSWKLGCSRGATGTPTFFVNGVFVNGQPTWTLADWRQVIDPLLVVPTSSVKRFASKKHATKKHAKAAKCSHRAASTRKFVRNPSSCPTGEPICNYLPGEFECCLPGEGCIPNVGCRC